MQRSKMSSENIINAFSRTGMHGMTQQSANTAPAAARGSLRLSGPNRAVWSCPGAPATFETLLSNIGYVCERQGHVRDGPDVWSDAGGVVG